MAAELVLDVLDFAEIPGGGLAWRWELRDEGGGELAEHAVRLEGGDELLTALTELPRYLRLNTVPDTRAVELPKLLARIGQEISERVFGPVSGVLDDYGPCAVRVRVPPQARAVAHLPLESAVLGDGTLPERGCSLVWDLLPSPADPPPEPKRPIGETLRVLALFSVPDGASALNLRKERRELTERLDELARGGRAIELEVLQYGTTRKRLEMVVKEEAGWHVVHISGHGWTADRPRDRDSGILLEEPDGSQDWIPTEKLVELLAPLRGHVRLVTASSCSSAGVTAAEYRRLLGLEEADGADDEAGADDAPPSDATPILAVRLAETLNCAVLGMRHNVTDDFAAALAAEVYPQLLGGGGAPAAVLGGSVQAALGSGPHPPLSASTPALFGAAAAGETIAAPVTDSPVSVKPEPIPGVGEPERFIGRTAVMARAGAALAPESGSSGVLLHGMAGAGKTTAAEELVALHRDRFESIVWYRAPDEGHDTALALSDLAGVLGKHIEKLDLAAFADDDHDRLRAIVPQLTELFRRRRILLVIDNAESLLTQDGAWRDERWGTLMDALTGHGGLSRVVITSRHRPAVLDAKVLAEPIHALSGDEAILLARELPHLGALYDDEDGRELLGRVLTLTQGHPVLLDISDGHAADRDALRTLLDQAQDTWQKRGATPGGFFTRTGTSAIPEDYLALLESWTINASRDLSEPARVLLHLLACIEPNHRFGFVLDGNWADLWCRLGQPGPPSDWNDALIEIARRGLADVQHPEVIEILLHPAIAAATRRHVESQFQESLDYQLAEFWANLASYFLEQEDIQATGEDFIHAARAALPYLLRRHETEAVTALLERILSRDNSQFGIAALAPLARANARQAHCTGLEIAAEFILARTLLPTDPADAETRLQTLLEAARSAEDHPLTSVITIYLIGRYHDTGRLDEALTLADELIDHTNQAELGPRTQAAAQGQRLKILNAMGNHTTVLNQAQTWLAALDQFTGLDPVTETVEPWNVREGLLDSARTAARGLRRWHEELDFTNRIIAAQSSRGAPELDTIRARTNDYWPLLQLGRIDDADLLLQHCREVFENHQAWVDLAKALGALASTHDQHGETDRAVTFAADALRYHYLADYPCDTAIGHANIGNYLAHDDRLPAALPHHLAATLIFALTHDGELQTALRNTALTLAHLPPDHPAPATVQALFTQVDQLPGVDLDHLLTHLATPEYAQQALDQILESTRQSAQEIHNEIPE